MLVIFNGATANAGSAKANNARTVHQTFITLLPRIAKGAQLIGQAKEQQNDADAVYKTMREHRNPQIASAEQIGRADHEGVAGRGEHAGRTLIIMPEAEEDRDI